MGLGVKFGSDGGTAETAIDKIYAVYGGQTSVTNTINGLKRDKKCLPTLELSSPLPLYSTCNLVVFQLSTVLVIKHGDGAEVFPTC